MEPAQKLLWTPANESEYLRGTEKTVSVKEPDDLEIALGQVDGGSSGSAFEAGKVGGGHVATVSETKLGK